MTEVRLDRNYYHLHEPIGRWCEEHFGAVDFFKSDNDQRWYRNMMFGYQDYHFAREADASFFTLRWVK